MRPRALVLAEITAVLRKARVPDGIPTTTAPCRAKPLGALDAWNAACLFGNNPKACPDLGVSGARASGGFDAVHAELARCIVLCLRAVGD